MNIRAFSRFASVLLLTAVALAGSGCESVGLRSMKIYIQQKNWEKAIEQGHVALAENPNDAAAWFAMAQVAAQVDSFDLMLRAIARTEALTNKYAADIKMIREAKYGTAFNKGVERYNANDMPGATRFMDLAIAIESNRANAYRLKGMIAQRLNDPAVALENFGRAFQADTSDVELARVYAQLLDVAGQREQAITILKGLYVARPGEKKVIVAYLQLLVEAERLDEALGVVNSALTRDPADPEFNMRAGVLWMQRAQRDQDSTGVVRDIQTAVPYFTKAVEADTANTDAAYNLAVCYARLNRRSDAISVM
jgi:tetratricopeptide (TPR) repeat protein